MDYKIEFPSLNAFDYILIKYGMLASLGNKFASVQLLQYCNSFSFMVKVILQLSGRMAQDKAQFDSKLNNFGEKRS